MAGRARGRFLDVIDEGRTAGGGEKALFGQFLGLGVGDHVRAERRFDHMVEAQPLDAGDDLPQLGVGELAGDRGRDDGVEPVVRVAGAALDEIHDVEDIRFGR